MRGVARIQSIVIAAVLLAGCDSSPTEPSASQSQPGTPEPVLYLVVTPQTATLRAGESVQLSAVATSQDRSTAREIAVTWESSDDGIATVSSTGLVRGLRPGQAEITVRWGSSWAKAQITVIKGQIDPPADLLLR